MRNNKHKDRKDGKFTGAYFVSDITRKGLVAFKNRKDKKLKKKYSKTQLKLFVRDLNRINEHEDFLENEIDQSGVACVENPIKDIIQNNQPLDEKLVENSQNTQIPDEALAVTIIGWDWLPDETVKKIIIQAINRSNHVCQTYKNIINSSSRFQIIRKKVTIFLPCIYVKLDDNIKKQFNEKIKLRVRKLLKVYGKESVLIIRVAELIGNKNGNKFGLYYYQKLNLFVQRIYWQKALEKSKKSPVNDNLSAGINQYDGFRSKKYHFYLKAEDENILLSSGAWLNDRIIDTAQALMPKTLGIQGYYQSVLNYQKRAKHCKAVTQDHIQLLYDNHNHWFLKFFT